MGNTGDWFNHLDGGGGVRVFRLWDKEENKCQTHTKKLKDLWLKEFKSWDHEAQRKGFRF